MKQINHRYLFNYKISVTAKPNKPKLQGVQRNVQVEQTWQHSVWTLHTQYELNGLLLALGNTRLQGSTWEQGRLVLNTPNSTNVGCRTWLEERPVRGAVMNVLYMMRDMRDMRCFSVADMPSLRGMSHAAHPVLFKITGLRTCHRREMQKTLLLPHSYSDTNKPITKPE